MAATTDRGRRLSATDRAYAYTKARVLDSTFAGGDLLSFQNNRNNGNTVDGAPTGNIGQQ